MNNHVLHSSQPIGIFDSGTGGLTIANAVTKLLPHESIIYFGDIAHHPYGDKSTAAIQAYTIKICDIFLQQQCKLIMIACHSASSAAYELVKEYVGSKAHVVNVIDPTINYLRESFPHKSLGLIGTRQTINSNIYQKKITELQMDIKLHALATPLLAPMIEEGFAEKPLMSQVIADYLSHSDLKNIDGLVLACTHYPLLKKQINAYYQDQVALIDPADIAATAAKGLLEHYHLLHQAAQPKHKFYVSEYTDAFAATTKIFFPQTIHLEHYPLWD